MIYIIQIIGVSIFAISGALAAAKNRLDIVGAIVLGFITAVGGGTIRDVLLNQELFWIKDVNFMYWGFGSALFMYLILLFIPKLELKIYDKLTKPLIYSDAGGLALFSILGVNTARKLDLPFIIAITMGVITAVGGGLLRDVLSAKTPLLFSKGHWYAFSSILGCISYWILLHYLTKDVAAIIGIAIILVSRMLAVKRNWVLPSL